MTATHAELVVNCDGASRGNPGPAGAGASVAAPDGVVVAEVAEGLGVQTNNVAEYTAVIRGLEVARDLGARRVTVRSDSLLLVNQLHGTFRVKTEHLRPLHSRVRALQAAFEHVAFEHVPREQNAEADRLANLGVDRWLAAQQS